jgi:hypothetical protein
VRCSFSWRSQYLGEDQRISRPKMDLSRSTTIIKVVAARVARFVLGMSQVNLQSRVMFRCVKLRLSAASLTAAS